MKRMNRYTCGILSLLALSSGVRAETTDCTGITAVPYNITAPGIYCLKNSVSGDGITIRTNDVVLDLNGHTLEAGKFGVHSDRVVKNITVRNGAIRADTYAVHLQGNGATGYHLVEGLRAEGVVHVGGNGSVVRNNRVITASIPVAVTIHYAIQVAAGTGIRVSDNTIVNPFLPGANEIGGIRVTGGTGAVVERNAISSTTLPTAPSSRGILLQASTGSAVIANHITNLQQGVANTNDTHPVIFRDNTVHGAVTPYQGGVMAGTTNHSF